MPYTRRFLQVVAFLATLVVGSTAMAVIITQTTWFKEWLRSYIVRRSSYGAICDWATSALISSGVASASMS